MYGVLYTIEPGTELARLVATRVDDSDGRWRRIGIDGQRCQDHRMVSIVRALRGRLRDPFPEGTFSESLDESVSGQHSSANYHNASIIVFLWVGFYLLGVFVLLVVLSIGSGAVPVKNVLFEVASAQGNVGLTSGITTPSTPSKPLLPASAKVMLTLNMWVGRLEIIPVLVFFRVLFWEAENE